MPSPQATPKGYGLKKWRRRMRDVNQGGSSGVDDTSSVLKRGLSNSKNSIPNLRNTLVNNNSVVGRNSGAENRMDHHTSNTSDGATLIGKNLPNSGNSVEQKGKGKLETSKKARGGRVKIEKENIHSTYTESDSRSLNFVSMQQADTTSGTSNGRQSTDGNNNSDEVQGVRHSFVGGSFGEDVGVDLSSEKIKEDEFENYGLSMDRDSLVESITMLESAQEALEKEIQKLREIGKEDTLAPSDDLELSFPDPIGDSADLLQLSEVRPDSPHSMESRMIVLKQNVSMLESNLKEAKATLEVKEAKVMELEATLNSTSSSHSSRGSSCSQSARKSTRLNIELQQGEGKDEETLVTELESLFKRRIEAEVEYLVISRTIQNLRFAAVGQMKLLEDAENKATMLKSRAEKLETSCCTAADIVVDTSEVFKLQKRLCKLTACFFIQLILLVLVVCLCVLQLSPPYVEDFVPT